jgi:hypothetical protein
MLYDINNEGKADNSTDDQSKIVVQTETCFTRRISIKWKENMRILTGMRIEEDLLLKGRAKAKREHRSFSNYLETLIMKDLHQNKIKLEQDLDESNS